MIVLGYIADWAYKPLRAGDIDRMTHVNIAFALVKDGRGSVAHWSNAAGIEHAPEDGKNYTEWVRVLREKLGPDRLLTMACGASQNCCDALELKDLVKLMNFFNIMTYDMCPWSRVGHHTALYASDIIRSPYGAEAIERYHKAGVPMNQLTLGAAFYAREYKNVDGLNSDVTEGGHPGFSGGYVKTLEKAANAGGEKYDEKAEAAYVYDEKERTFLTWDNERSIKAKVEYVKKQGLAGIMFWEYSSDDGDSTLLKAMAGK